MKTYKPEVLVVGVDAVGSSIFGGDSHAYRIPGIGLSWTPANIVVEHVDRVYKVSDEKAFVAARCLARNEGILMGPSSGACALVALAIAQQSSPKSRIVCMVSDGGERYMQTLFDDSWMQKQGFATGSDIETLHSISRQLEPWSTYPAQGANYRPDLVNSLGIPQTTHLINRNIGKKGSRTGYTVFID